MTTYIEYDICRKKTSNASYSLDQKNGQEVVSKSISVAYRVHASEGSTWPHSRSINASDVDEEMVRNAQTSSSVPSFNNTLPVVGDTYFESPDGMQYPWWRCTSVSINRNASNGLEFDVNCTFVDKTGTSQGISPPVNVEEVEPVISYEFDQFEVTAWTEDGTTKQTSGQEPPQGWPDPDPCVLPTGTLYSNPPVKIVGQEKITFSQYEGGRLVPNYDILKIILGDENEPGRLFSVNKSLWRVYSAEPATQPNQIAARHAMITDIAYEDTSLLLQDGTRDPCKRVTYTISIRRYALQSLKDNPTAGSSQNLTETLYPGWDQPRVRADTRFRDGTADEDIHSAANIASWGTQQCYLKASGQPHLQEHQYGVPPYDILKLQPEIDFNTFLR